MIKLIDKISNATICHLHLTSNGSSINIVDSAKYLGVVIDNKLNFKQHIKIMKGKVARSVEYYPNYSTSFLKTLCCNFFMH